MNTNRSRVINPLVGCAVVGVIGWGAMGTSAQAATTSGSHTPTTTAAKGSPIGEPSTSGGVTTKHYADGNGGQVTVKTTTSGESAKYNASGNIVSKSDGWGASSGSTSSSTAGKTGTSSSANEAISQTKKAATAATELNVIKNGDAGAVLNTPAGSAASKEAWGKAQAQAGASLPKAVGQGMSAVSMVKNASDYAAASQATEKDPAKILKSGGGVIADGASLAGAGPAATLGKAAWNAGVDVGTGIQKYTNDTQAVGASQQRIADQMTHPDANPVVNTLKQTVNVLRVIPDTVTGAYQKATGQDPATPKD